MSGGIELSDLSGGWSSRKRSSRAPVEADVVVVQQQMEIAALRGHLDTLHAPLVINCPGVFNMDLGEHKRLLGDALWKGQFRASMEGLRAANPALVAVLTAQIKNNYHPKPRLREQAAATKRLQVDGILANLLRTRSQKAVTTVSASLTVLAEANCVSEEFRSATTCFFKGAFLSERWVGSFMPLARTLRPPPPSGSVPGVALVVFDNLTIKCNYGSYFKDGETGIKLDMTNWMWTPIPPSLAPTFDALKFGSGPLNPQPYLPN